MKNIDLISREALLKKAQPLLSFDGKEVVWVRDNVLLAPTIDPVHAAGGCYCKECENEISTDHIRKVTGAFWCKHKLQPCEPDDFCSWGKPKTSPTE